MLAAQLGEKFCCGPGASGSYVFLAFVDAFDGRLKILALPFEISRQCLIQSNSGILAVALGVFLQLRSALRF